MNSINLSLNKGETIAFVGDAHIDSVPPSSRIDDTFQTVMNKLNFIFNKCKEENVKALFWAGDIFNKVSLPFSPVNTFMDLLIDFRNAGIQNLAICGNHDIMRNSMDYLNRSPVQTLFSSGLMSHISKEVNVNINDDIIIHSVDYPEYPEPVKKSEKGKFNLLLCHMFINANGFLADEKHNLTTDVIKKLKYDAIVAGHDHEEYPSMNIEGTMVYRPGSILRGTSHDYNFTRKPNFLIMQEDRTLKKVVIDHMPYKDVVSAYVLNKKQEGSISGLQDVLSNLASRLSMSTSDDGDRILEIIKSDPNLPTESRLQILEYVGEIS